MAAAAGCVRGSGCFNEASALQRRKLLQPFLLVAAAQVASMRPPLFSGGNGRIDPRRRKGRPRFNEASALQRRKRAASALASEMFDRFNEASALQRRKRFSAPAGVLGFPPASMRPPLFSGGNARRLFGSRAPCYLLQ